MTLPERLTLLPVKAMLGDTNDRQLDRALREAEDQWVDDFIRRLNCAIEGVVCKKK